MTQTVRRRTVPRRPATRALAAGQCMFSPFGQCSGGVAPIGIRGDDDRWSVLTCAGHHRNLRQLGKREAETLTRYLTTQFTPAA